MSQKKKKQKNTTLINCAITSDLFMNLELTWENVGYTFFYIRQRCVVHTVINNNRPKVLQGNVQIFVDFRCFDIVDTIYTRHKQTNKIRSELAIHFRDNNELVIRFDIYLDTLREHSLVIIKRLSETVALEN